MASFNAPPGKLNMHIEVCVCVKSFYKKLNLNIKNTFLHLLFDSNNPRERVAPIGEWSLDKKISSGLKHIEHISQEMT